MARLLGTQEHFNASVVQFVNTLNEAAGPALGALDDVERHREALAARERRMEAEMARDARRARGAAHRVGVLRQANHDLAREIERAAPRPAAAPGRGSGPPAPRQPTPATGAGRARATSTSASRISSAARPRRSASGWCRTRTLFAGASDVLDVGCGRGEFLALLARARHQRAAASTSTSRWWRCAGRRACRPTRADALAYLRAQPAGSLGGLLAAQVVEHLDPGYLTTCWTPPGRRCGPAR